MTLTLTQPKKIVHNRGKHVKRRKARLFRSGHTYEDLRGLAKVTYSMAWKWMNGERKSRRCQLAYDYLLSKPKREGTR